MKIITSIIAFVFLFFFPAFLSGYSDVGMATLVVWFIKYPYMLSMLGVGLFLFGVFWIDKVNKLFIKRDYELGGRGYPFIILGLSIWYLERIFQSIPHFIVQWWIFLILVGALIWLLFSYMKNISDFASKDFVVNKRTNLYCLIGSLSFLLLLNIYISIEWYISYYG